MNRTSLSTLLLLTALGGCAPDNKASDLQQDANAAQNKANATINDVRVDANQDMRTAQAAADKKIASAEADFSKLREDYRHATTIKMVDLEKKIADLEAKRDKANGSAKADLSARLKVINSTHKVFMDDYATLDQVSGATWDDTKTRLDREWTDLETLVNKA